MSQCLLHLGIRNRRRHNIGFHRPFIFVLIVAKTLVVITFNDEQLLEMRNAVQLSVIHSERFHSKCDRIRAKK